MLHSSKHRMLAAVDEQCPPPHLCDASTSSAACSHKHSLGRLVTGVILMASVLASHYPSSLEGCKKAGCTVQGQETDQCRTHVRG